MLTFVLLLTACGPGSPSAPQDYQELDPLAHAVRASMALRGVRPTIAELEQVRRDPQAIDALVDEWVQTPEFGEVAKDMYAEWLQVRADVIDPLPALGPLEGRTLDDMSFSLSEAPLELVRYVVDNDLPLTDLVTTDVTMADPVVAAAYGLPYDDSDTEHVWQPSHWIDGRPNAGLITESEVWRRHESAGSNFNRLRANLVADVFLCSDFASRDIVVEGGITISDEFQVAQATRTQTECVNCHQALDPLATYFFGFKKQVKRTTVSKSYRANCSAAQVDDPFKPYAPADFCYPLEMYSTEDEDWWMYWDLPNPGYYGAPGTDLEDLGEHIAADPRFAQCAARRFYGWMTQSDPLQVPLPLAEDLQGVLEQSGFSAKALAKAVVLSDSCRAVASAPGAAPEVPAAGMQIVRPEQFARSVEALTGFAWRVDPDHEGCDDGDTNGTDCWGAVDVMRSDRFGYRAMAGGIDGFAITRPIHQPTPPRELVWERFAEEAAAYVANNDLAEPDHAARRLLTQVDADDTSRAAVAGQIASLYPALLGRFPAADDADVQDLADVWADKYARSADPAASWALVVAAMLIDPDAVFY
ncbi:MAG: hypothetical protein R3F59_19340 [Myxococcota bacterium]